MPIGRPVGFFIIFVETIDMLCRFFLNIGSNEVDITSPDCFDVSSMIANLDEIKVSYSRIDFGGVIRKCTSEISFIGEARDRIVEYFRVEGLKSIGSFAVECIRNDWTYERLYDCPLDFSTLKYDNHEARIGCIDNTIAALIKANMSTQYEYKVSEVKEPCGLLYDGITIRNDVSFQMIGDTVEGEVYMTRKIEGNVWWWIPKVSYMVNNEYMNSSFIAVDQNEDMLSSGDDCGWGFPSNSCTTSWFMECINENDIEVDFSSFKILSGELGYVLFRIRTDGTLEPLTCGYSNLLTLDDNTGQIVWKGRVYAGEKLQFAVFIHDRLTSETEHNFRIYPVDGSVSWNGRGEEFEIDVVKPESLLKRLLYSMSGNKEGIPYYIDDTVYEYDAETGEYLSVRNDRLCDCMLVAAESIRDFPEAKIYTSFSKFCEWMEAEFGYVYSIQKRKLEEGASMSYSEELLPVYQFDGFTDHVVGDSSEEETIYPSFSTLSGCFLSARFAGIVGKPYVWGYTFPNSENYQDSERSGLVYTDRVFRDICSAVIYMASVFENGVDGSGNKVYFSTLYEMEVEVMSGSYGSTKRGFAGFVHDVVDSGTYSGESEPWIYFCHSMNMFVGKVGLDYFTVFPGSNMYNSGGSARSDIIFVHSSYTYVMHGHYGFVRCTVKEGEEDVDMSDMVDHVCFMHRDMLFSEKSRKKFDDVSGFKYSVASERIYSSVTIGYERQDYDLGNNGNDEFNFSITYTTGTTLSDKELSLISPYRADSYGFEELCEKRGDEKSATDSDKQVFCLNCRYDTGRYLLVRDLTVDGSYSDTVFNARFSPYYMIMSNMGYLASFADMLTFASTEGSSDIVIDGNHVTDDIPLSGGIFGFGNISFETSDMLVPDDWNRCDVSFESNGITYVGSLSSLEIRVMDTDTYEYVLIEKK